MEDATVFMLKQQKKSGTGIGFGVSCLVLGVWRCRNEITNTYSVGFVSIKHTLLFDPRGVILVQVTVIVVNCSSQE